jgi:ABC-2 type transport system ATP-binding protein
MDMTELTNAIETTGLTKRYGRSVGIVDVTFTLAKGAVLGILGPSGAGKTTLIGLLAGIIGVSKGKALVGGIDVVKRPKAVCTHVGVVSDRVQVYDELSVEGNLVLLARLYGLKPSAAKERVEEVTSLLELEGQRKVLCGRLPRGIRKKVLIAAAIIHEPEVLLFDEPTAELDPHAASLVRNYVSSISHSWRATLWTTNMLGEAEKICNRMLILASGRVIAEDNPQRFTRGIAGSGTVDITVSGIRTNTVADVFDALNASFYSTSSGEVILTVENSQEILDRVFTLIGRVGASITSIEGKKPTLEDAYLQVIGEEKK